MFSQRTSPSLAAVVPRGCLDGKHRNHRPGCFGVIEYYRREALRIQLGLHPDYRFEQCEEDEEMIAVQNATGHRIRWTGHWWVDYQTGEPW